LEELRAKLEAEEQAKKQIDFDFKAKEKEYMEAVLDGETDKALAIREEIREAERKQFELELEQRTSQAVEISKAEIELKETIEAAQSTYPVFDANSDKFDQELTAEALDLFESFKLKGYEPADAMRRAVRYVVRANGLEIGDKPAAQAPAAQRRQPAKPTTEQVEKKLEQASRQPPAGTPNRAEDRTPNIFELSEEDFDKLSREELARIRGDMIT